MSVSLTVWMTDCDPLHNGYSGHFELCFTYFYKGGRPRTPQRDREKCLLCTSVLHDQAPPADLLNLMHSVRDLESSPPRCLQLQNRITASLLFQVPICRIHLDPDPSRTDYLYLVHENRTGANAKYCTAAKEGANKWATTIKGSYTLALIHWSHLLTHPSYRVTYRDRTEWSLAQWKYWRKLVLKAVI